MGKEKKTSTRATFAEMAGQIAALAKMTTDELRGRYLEICGEPTRTRNAEYLRRRLAWEIQSKAEGGLSARADARIAELGHDLPLNWRKRMSTGSAEPPAEPDARDPRLPPPGTILKRAHGGQIHAVTVRFHDFEYNGAAFKSLSKIARDITGTRWNGFAFFGLKGGK